MTSLINFSGIASGIDSSALIKAILDQEKSVRITPLQTKVQSFTDTNSAFSKLKELLNKLNTSAQKFRAVNGSVLAKSGTSSDETILTASANGSATNGTYSINVTQLAKNATFSFNDRFSASDAVINSSINNGASAASRTVSVQVGTGSNQETVNLELTSSSTLTDFVNQFNASSTKATASVVNVGTSGSPSYAISIIGNEQGIDNGQIAVSVGSEIQTAGSGAFTGSTVSQATNATFTISGVSGTITKSSNAISDVIPGLTLNFQSTGTATVSVADNVSGTSNAIQDFVSAYNEVIKFVKEQDLVERQEDGKKVTNIFGPLAGTSLDENVVSSLRQALVGASTSGQTVNTLADLGITTERDGTLKFDSSVLQDAISDDPEALRTITQNLGESLGAVDGTIAQYTRFNGLIDVASKSNSDAITDLNDRIATVQDSLNKREQSLVSQFARLESLIGQLNSQQNSLSQVLPR
ncbi:MAG: flagellar filament capping protein FliD [Oligoflexia bacterium]|nr:flagellar filament capping protein FliD [Oligoflexia bacterium]